MDLNKIGILHVFGSGYLSMYIKLVDSVDLISSRISAACSEEINAIFMKKRYLVASACKRLASSWIMRQPEISSLASGMLSGLFGLYAGTENMVVSQIASAVEQSVEVNVTKISKNLKGGITMNFQPASFSNLLNLTEGHVIYEGGDLHWLNWLLTLGDSAIVVNYSYSPKSGLGRSGRGIMKTGGMFRVPPQFSGTIENNFITRALTSQDSQDELNKEIQRIFT